jgi:hypothetical protein
LAFFGVGWAGSCVSKQVKPTFVAINHEF